MTTLYTAHVTSTGGRDGKIASDDGVLSLQLAKPVSKTGTNPEQLFAAGYSACFASAVEYIAKQKQLSSTGLTVQTDVSLYQDTDGFSIGVILRVALPELDDGRARDVVQAAHQMCPYSKAIQGNIEVKLHVNGKPLV